MVETRTGDSDSHAAPSEPWRKCMKPGEIFGQVFYCTKGHGHNADDGHLNFDSGMSWFDELDKQG